MISNAITQETLEKVQQQMGEDAQTTITKAYTQSLGLVNYDLQPVALNLFPVLAPLRNIIPRVSGNGGTATNWRAITGLNTTSMLAGVSEANRSGFITSTAANLVATYKGLGLEDYVSFEADYASGGFMDVKARAVANLLAALMMEEERVIVGGNAGQALGTCNTPTVATSTTGGSIATATAVYVRAVALTMDGYRRTTVAAGCPGQITRTNADATTDNMGGGNGIVSAAGNQTTGAGSTNSISASVVRQAGEVAYAWYWGATSAGATLGAITTTNNILITTATGSGAQTAADAKVGTDYSQNALIYDGLISQIMPAGALTTYDSTLTSATIYTANTSNALVGVMATGTPGTGTVLTSDNSGGVVEIDQMLQNFWNLYRLSPSKILVNAQEAKNINKRVLAASTGSLFRFNTDWTSQTDQSGIGGTGTRGYFNKFTGQMLQIVIHPYIPAGTILFWSDSIPYPLSGVGNTLQIKTRRDYYQLEWPVTKRRYEYGVYMDGVLQNYVPIAFGALVNIANG